MNQTQFVRELTTTAKKFVWTSGDGAVRGRRKGRKNNCELCPIEAVASGRGYRGQRDYQVDAQKLGLTTKTRHAIVAASDSRAESPLRTKLLKAVGLEG